MDTTTRKQEALYILKVIERGSADREFIGEARRKFYDLMNAQGCERRDYLDSVDACLTLSRPANTWWRLEGDDNDPNSLPVPGECSAQIKNAKQEEHYARTLPLAMLTAWWQAQP